MREQNRKEIVDDEIGADTATSQIVKIPCFRDSDLMLEVQAQEDITFADQDRLIFKRDFGVAQEIQSKRARVEITFSLLGCKHGLNSIPRGSLTQQGVEDSAYHSLDS